MVLWVTINTIAIALVTFVLYLVVRQMGVILNYVGPLGARHMDAGPRIGEVVSTVLENTSGKQLLLDRPVLLVFASRSCSICKAVRRACEELSRHWGADVRIVVVYDEPIDPYDAAGLHIFGDAQFREALDVDMVPYGVALDAQGRVVVKGLINNISHVESLLEQLPVRPSAVVAGHGLGTSESQHVQA